MTIQSRLQRIEKRMDQIRMREEMLNHHESEEFKEFRIFIQSQGEEYRKMFAKVIKEVARERGLV